MERKHPLGPRLGAWVIDNILIALATVVVLLSVLGANLQPQSLLQVVQRFPGLQSQTSRWHEVATHFETVGFTPEELILLNQIVNESLGHAVTAQMPQNVWDSLNLATDPAAALSTVVNRAIAVVQEDPRLAGIDSNKLAVLKNALDTFSNLMGEVRPEEVLGVVFEIARRLALWLFLVPALYFFLEAVLGFSLGKLIFGLRVVRQKGDGIMRGNPLVFLLRWILKSSGWLTATVGLWMGIWFILGLGMGLNLVMSVSGFGVLNDSFQTLYDGMSGTGIASHKDLEGI